LSRLDFILQPIDYLQGELVIPGDKSISHRALLLGSLAQGKTYIHNCLLAEDIFSTIQALCYLGIKIEQLNDGLIVHGNGKYSYKTPKAELNLANSGTSLRLIAAILAGQGISATLTGDPSLRKRPMARIIQPLVAMGAKILSAESYMPPLIIQPIPITTAIEYQLPVASAQVKSALLLAALYCKGLTTITEPLPTRDHTERMLPNFGIELTRQNGKISLSGGQTLLGTELNVPGDISAAAFFIVAACIAKQAKLTLRNVGVNPTRLGIIHLLRRMGADIRLHNFGWFSNEPIADITVQSSKLKAITVESADVALSIDELPVFCIAAACAVGQTTITGAAELRHKESDRIKAMANGLTRLGIKTLEHIDGLTIDGGVIQGGIIDAVDDHRIAMAFSVAAAAAVGPIKILNCANVSTSFPSFVELARKIGFGILTLTEETMK
jgi:3-phosphoshikimate 1-carboxyvinyltransferase